MMNTGCGKAPGKTAEAEKREISIMHKAVVNGMLNRESLETRALRGMACASLRALS